MNQMIEKVARALCARRTEAGMQRDWTMSLATRPLAERVADYVDNNWTAYQDDARAAIEAMRVPTEPMLQAMHDGALMADDHEMDEGARQWLVDMWADAIVAAGANQ